MAKLTLSVDDAVISRAKRYAQRHNTSVSGMVADYLSTVTAKSPAEKFPPVVKSLKGILKSADPAGYRRHILRKYQ
jgi:hypothetical protein